MNDNLDRIAIAPSQPGAWRWLIPALALLLALLLPVVAPLFGLEFYVSLARRIMIYAIAATSLNFILGYGGMVAFGHAAFVGLGAYTVAILADAGQVDAWLVWPLAVAVAAAAAGLVGAISLRTRGVYFIMITLAFAQMIYYLSVSLKTWGGEDGLNLAARSIVGAGLDLTDDTGFYYVVLALLLAVLFLLDRMVGARFGRALIGIRENETRMEGVGHPTFAIRWTAFVIAGGIAGLAGALLANHNNFVSPSLMHWTQSGNLLIMVILGGVGQRYAGLIGAVVMLGIEELFSGLMQYWHWPIGLLLLAVVLFAPRGLSGLRWPGRRARP